jgi:hypothetical protein
MENNNNINNEEDENNKGINKYLKKIIEKFSFIECIFLTNIHGANIAMTYKKENEESDYDKLKILFTYKFKSFYEQISKIEKWGVNSIVAYYDNHTIYQGKINDDTFIHFACSNDKYNQEILKEIKDDIEKKLKK